MKLFNILALTTLLFSICLYAETDESKAIVSYIQTHIKASATPLPDKLKNRANDINLLENFVKTSTLSLDKIPDEILKKCKDLVFRESLLALVQLLKIKIASDDKTIETIIQKFKEQDVYKYLSAKIDLMLSNNDAFNAAIKSASQEVKDFVLLELLLNTASQFGTTKDYQKTDAFKKNEAFIKLTIDAGAKINDVLNKLQGLGLSASEQETFINSLLAPHFDYIEFLIKNGLDKNLSLPAVGTQKKRSLVEFYEDQLKTATEKLEKVVSTELKNTQSESQKIIALLKPAPAQKA